MIIQLINIAKIYNFNKHNCLKALDKISLQINQGDFCAIVGKSGSGKSTLLHIIGLLDKFSSGKYYLDKCDVSKYTEKCSAKLRANYIGFVKQEFALIDEYTAFDNVMLPLYPIHSSAKTRKTMIALEKIGIKDLASKEVKKLSGGEKQRVAIARAIVNNPSIILADEPTGSLDSKTAAEIMEVFKSLNAEGKTIIIVTHDIGIANQCNRIIEISDGVIISDSKK